VRFDTKIAVVIREDLAAWQKIARQRGVELAIYTQELFSTSHDEANRAAVADVPEEDLDLVGIAMHADGKVVDRVLDRLRPHP
jgi:hypothetical protein